MQSNQLLVAKFQSSQQRRAIDGQLFNINATPQPQHLHDANEMIMLTDVPGVYAIGLIEIR
jgi:hypothetical protein